MGKIPYLNGLRGFAALQVVMIHYLAVFLPATQCSPFWPCWQQWLRERFLFFFIDGTSAVSLFFVLSGFVLSRSFAKTSQHPFRNALKRWTRLEIPTACSLFFAFGLYCFFGFAFRDAFALNDSQYYTRVFWAIPPTFVSLLRETFEAALFLGYRDSSVFAGFGNDFLPGEQSLNTVLWSLHVEFWGSMIVVLLAYLRPHPPAHYLAILCCFALFPMHNLILFVMGHLLACSSNDDVSCGARLRFARNLAGLFFAALGVFIATGREDLVPPDLFFALNEIVYFHAQSPFHFAGMFAALSLFFGVFLSPWLQSLFNLPLFQKLGELSFGLFLLHTPILLTFTAFLELLFHRLLGHATAVACSAAIGLLLTFVAASLFTKGIDVPAINFSRRIGKGFSDRFAHGRIFFE